MRVVVVILSILLLAWTPGIAFAQGLGLPSFGGLMGGPSCAPKPEPKGGAGLAFEIGYLTTNPNVSLDFTADQIAVLGVNQVQHRYSVQGLWLALSADGRVGDLGVFARGSWLVPSNKESEESYSGAPGHRTWGAKTQWYTVEGAGMYPAYGSFAVVSGFRYDAFDTSFSDPFNPVGVVSLPSDEADVTIRAYIPYLGLVVNQDAALKFGLIGFPYLFGNVKYNQTNGGFTHVEASGALQNGYFVEAFAEWGAQTMGGYAGIFGTWTYVRASSDLDLTPSSPIAAPPAQPFTFSMQRQNFIFGGKFALSFNLPYIPF